MRRDDALADIFPAWSRAYLLAGSYGLRPMLTTRALTAFRSDGSTIVVSAPGGLLPVGLLDEPLALSLLAPGGAQVLATTDVEVDVVEELAEPLLAFHAAHATDEVVKGRIRHFPPASELERLELAMSYATLYPYLVELATRGIHAYVESETSTRVYFDIADQFLVDISIADAGIRTNFADEHDEWVVFITDIDANAYVAEFTVARHSDLLDDATELADGVALGVSEALRDGHIFLGDYRGGRLSDAWFA